MKSSARAKAPTKARAAGKAKPAAKARPAGKPKAAAKAVKAAVKTAKKAAPAKARAKAKAVKAAVRVAAKPAAKSAPKPAARTAVKPAPKAATKAAAKPTPKAAPKAAAKPAAKPAPKAAPKATARPATKAPAKPVVPVKSAAPPKPATPPKAAAAQKPPAPKPLAPAVAAGPPPAAAAAPAPRPAPAPAPAAARPFRPPPPPAPAAGRPVSPPPPRMMPGPSQRPPHRLSAAPAAVAAASRVAPRPKEDFKAGDHVVYPTHGVGQVQGIETIEAAGYALQVIVVTFEENRMTLRVPVNKAASSGLRKLAVGAMMQQALDTLKGRARIKRTMWSRRAQEYEAKINSGDPVQIAEVVRDLHRNAGQPDQSFSERQIYEQALDRLAAEVAAIDATDKPKAIEKMMTYLGKAEKGAKEDKAEAVEVAAE